MPGFLPLQPALQIFGRRGPMSRIKITVRNVNGHPEKTEAAPEAITGVVHPATGRDIERLPEGKRDRETLWLFTSTPFDTGDERTDEGADIFVYTPPGESEPKRYIVHRCENWSGASTAKHFRCLVYREL